MESFRPVDIADRELLQQFLTRYPNEASECTFSNLFIWGNGDGIEWAVRDDVLLLHAMVGGVKPCMLMALADHSRIGAALDAAVAAMEERGEPFHMRCLPQWYCRLMEEARPGRFCFEREPHHDDYVYRVEDLINLSGKRYHGKRNHVNRFLQEYGDRYIYEAFTPALAQECMELHMQWYRAHRDTGSPGLREECESVERALFNAGALGLVGGVVRVDGKVQAFSMGESITDQMALIHIEKANAEIPGLYAVINREFLAHSFAAKTFVNREEDMGDEGLRRAKQSYHPARMIEKFGARLV